MHRLCGMLTALVCISVVLGPARLTRAQFADWSHTQWQCRRKVTVTVPRDVPVERLVGTVRFMTFGHLKPDGSDLRVRAARRDVPFRILHVGPGDEVTVAFGLIPDMSSYVFYFGNPAADAPDEKLDINAGLLLEVRNFPGGQFKNLTQTKAMFARARRVMGVRFIGNVFQGYNPFGSPSNFVARYSGFLNIIQPGTYTFASTSTHTSFLLVDGKQVVACRAWRRAPYRAPRGARFTGKVRLDAGVHAFEYYHVHTWGTPTTAVAAWKPPGARRFVQIPPGAFVPVGRAKPGPLQKRRARITPDFTFTRTEAVLTPDGVGHLQRYRFTDGTAAINHKNYTALWDFGDGITSSLWQPTHVYLTDGPVKVSLTVRGPLGRATSVQQVVVGRDWSRQAARHADQLKTYYNLVRGYDFAKMPTKHVVRSAYFFERLGKYRDMVDVSRQLVFDRTDLKERDRRERGLAVVDVLRHKLARPGETLKFLARLEETSASQNLKARFAISAGRINLDDLHRFDEARKNYNRVVANYPRAKRKMRRRALIGLGNAAWLAHDGVSATTHYERAEKISPEKKDRPGKPVMVGHLSRVIEETLRQGELSRAEEHLEMWEWERPTDRLGGYSTILRSKLFIARERHNEAVRHLRALLATTPRSHYAPEALILMAKCLQGQEKFREAAAALRKLLVDYPESGLAKKAAKQLKSLEP